MATTEAAVFDRVRDVMDELEFNEAPWDDFSRTPVTDDRVAYAVNLETGSPKGQIGGYEEVRGMVEISWQRLTNDDQVSTKSRLLVDKRAILSALVADATSGNYAVDDGGQKFEITFPRDSGVGRALLRVPINFEAALT